MGTPQIKPLRGQKVVVSTFCPRFRLDLLTLRIARVASASRGAEASTQVSRSPAEAHLSRAALRGRLQDLLDALCDALALVETAERAMDADGHAHSPVATLRHGIRELRWVHEGLDLALLGAERHPK